MQVLKQYASKLQLLTSKFKMGQNENGGGGIMF